MGAGDEEGMGELIRTEGRQLHSPIPKGPVGEADRHACLVLKKRAFCAREAVPGDTSV